MIYKYRHFLLIKESVTKYSDEFVEILSLMKSPIAKDLLDPKNEGLPILNVEVDKGNDGLLVITTPHVSKDVKYRIIDNGLTYANFKSLFMELGFKNTESNQALDNGTVGIVKKTIPNPSNSRITLAHFISDNGEECLIGTEGLKSIAGRTSQLRVGRFVKQFCDKFKFSYTTKEIEDFVNEYKAIFSYTKDGFHRFELVSGNDIQKYYHESRYESQSGTLGSSCMRGDSCRNFFQIYTMNTDVVQLLILKSKTKDGFIIGRALVWKTTDPKITFMDRIYTINDSDIELFKKYATSNGWLYKDRQNNSNTERFVHVDGTKEWMDIFVKISPVYYVNYPYLDTLRYYDDEKGILSNSWMEGCDELLSTGGGSTRRSEDDSDDDDWDDE